MKKIINLILVISLIFILIKIIFVLNTYEDYKKYNYNEIKLLINSSDLNVALNTFGQFDEYFADVYIDSTEIYQLQNSLKLYPEKYLDYYLDILSCSDIKSLLELFENKFKDSLIYNKYEKQIFQNIMTVILEYFSKDNLRINIGYDLLRAFNSKMKSNNYNNYIEINLVLKPADNHNELNFYNEIFEVIDDINDDILNIIQIHVHTKFSFEVLSDYVEKNNTQIDIKLNEYYYGFSSTLDDLKKTINILNNDIIQNNESSIEFESLLNFAPYDNSLFGNRFKKIKRYSIQKEMLNNKMIISNKEIITVLDSYKYYINQEGNNKIDNYIYKKEILEVLDKIIIELSKKNNVAKSIYMQDQFYNIKKNFSKYFYSLEPITLEYLNSSIKKEFIYNNYFISKIFFKSSSDKYFDFVNKAFDHKTTISESNQVYLKFLTVIILLLFLNNFKLIFNTINKRKKT